MHRFARPTIRRFSMAGLAALTLAACSSGGTSAPVPVVSSFAATPSSVFPGESTTLTWAVSGATSISIDHGVGTVTGTSIVVRPAETTRYTLTATNDAGARSASTSVIVAPAPVPEIVLHGDPVERGRGRNGDTGLVRVGSDLARDRSAAWER